MYDQIATEHSSFIETARTDSKGEKQHIPIRLLLIARVRLFVLDWVSQLVGRLNIDGIVKSGFNCVGFASCSCRAFDFSVASGAILSLFRLFVRNAHHRFYDLNFPGYYTE